MTRDESPSIEAQFLTLSADEIRELERAGTGSAQLDEQLREAAQLCLQCDAALAGSLAAERPKLLTSVVLARHKRRWRWHAMLWGIFIPLGILVLMLFGTAIVALVTAFLWR
jgi:hypothetical protein